MEVRPRSACCLLLLAGQHAGAPDTSACHRTVDQLEHSPCPFAHMQPANVMLKGARNDRRGFICKLGCVCWAWGGACLAEIPATLC